MLTGYADVAMVKEALHPRGNGASLALYFLQKDELDQLPKYAEMALARSSIRK